MIARRAFVSLLGGGAAGFALGGQAAALGRTPVGGRLQLQLPWSLATIDPHDLRDPAAAVFGAAVADPLFALDVAGNPYPTLAAAMPAAEPVGTVVRLREGLRTAASAALDGRDLISTIERARARGAAAWLADVPVPRGHPSSPFAVTFPGVEPGRLARLLASPLLALLPRKFNPAAPDGTGAFRAELGGGRLLLRRNLNAARGAAFLDEIEVRAAPDLRASLRAFESERDDVGWLGVGLHAGRRGAVRFDLGTVAWVVLLTGPEADRFGAPGVAQHLCDALPGERLAHLGLGPLPRGSGDPAWGGPPTGLVVDEGSPHLVEVAQAVAPILSRPGHEVTVDAVSRGELARRRSKGKLGLALDVVRPLAPGAPAAMVSLATADDPERGRDLMRHPVRLAGGVSPRSLTGTLRLGVLGDLRIAGGAAPDLAIARAPSEGWELGASFRRKKPR